MWPLDIRVRQRDYLLEISRALTSQLNIDEVLKLILEASVEMLNGWAGLIALKEAGQDVFTIRARYGIQRELLNHFQSLITDIPETFSERFTIPQLKQKVQDIAREVGIEYLRPVALPMTSGGGRDLIGVVYVFRLHGADFTPNERRLLQSFADQAAIAVHNANLYSQVVAEKRRLDAILQYSADGVFILDQNRRFITFNYALSHMIGWQPADAIGKPHDEVIQWARREPGMSLLEAEAGGWPLNARSTLYVEGDLLRTDGGTTSVGLTYAPLFDRENRLVNTIANVRDITRFRQAEEAKSTFISVVSHELKTPVSLIKGYASTLLRDDARWDQETISDGLVVIEEEADKLADLIENLLEASRAQSGFITLQKGEVRLDRLAERLVAKFSHQSDKHTFMVDFPSDFPVVDGDENRLRQVLTNLIGNAIKYSPAGGEVRISGTAMPDTVQIAVSDQGVGLPEEALTRIFERFYRVDDALTRKTQGAGLGLYIARSAVEAHGGEIWAESEPGKGATFIFTLPRVS